MRRAAKVDANQGDIVKALREAGASVALLHQVGKGVPDLLVGHQRRTFLLEVKDGSLPPSARRLTADQVEWWDAWRGQAPCIVNSVDEALGVLGITTASNWRPIGDVAAGLVRDAEDRRK